MSKIVNLLLIGGVGFLALKYFRIGKTAAKIDLGLKEVQIDKKKTNLTNTVINIRVSLYNPTDRGIRFEKFYGNVFLDEKRITDIDPPPYSKIITLAPRQEVYLPLTLNLKNTSILVEVVERIYDWIKNGTSVLKGTIRVEGHIVAEGLNIPYDMSKEISDI